MNIQEAKKELKEYVANKRYLERKQEEIDALTEQINKVTASYSDMPRGSANSKEDLIAKKLDMERETYSYLVGLIDQKILIERTIRSLEPKHRNILDFLYIFGGSLVEYAAKENYSYIQCKRFLKEAYIKYAEERSKGE